MYVCIHICVQMLLFLHVFFITTFLYSIRRHMAYFCEYISREDSLIVNFNRNFAKSVSHIQVSIIYGELFKVNKFGDISPNITKLTRKWLCRIRYSLMLMIGKKLATMEGNLREFTFTKIHKLMSLFFMIINFIIHFNNINIFICITSLQSKIATKEKNGGDEKSYSALLGAEIV